MPYRDERRCHICGGLTRSLCPHCSNPVCSEHTLASHLEGAAAAKREAAERLSRRLGGMDACQRCVDSELEASQGPFVAIMRSGDPIQVQMIVEALRDDGFDARTLGTQDASLLGAGSFVFEQRIEVPEPQAEEALATISSLGFVTPDEQGEQGEDQPAREEHASGAAERLPRRRSLGAGLAFVFPGASHYYAQAPWTGLFLTLTFFFGFALLAREALLAGAVLLLGTPLLDLVGGQLAISATNGGKPRSRGRQLALGLGLTGSLLTSAWLITALAN